MKRPSFFVAAFGLCAMPAVAAQKTTTVLLPAGPLIPVHIVGTISSGNAKAGDNVQIAVAKDIVVGGMIAVREGSGGSAVITSTDSAGGNGHSGSLGLKFNYVYSTDGGRIRLVDAEQKQTEEDRSGAKSTANIVGVATLGIGGLFAHNLAHGAQKTIDEKTIFSAFTSDTVHVDSPDRAQDVKYDH